MNAEWDGVRAVCGDAGSVQQRVVVIGAGCGVGSDRRGSASAAAQRLWWYVENRAGVDHAPPGGTVTGKVDQAVASQWNGAAWIWMQHVDGRI